MVQRPKNTACFWCLHAGRLGHTHDPRRTERWARSGAPLRGVWLVWFWARSHFVCERACFGFHSTQTAAVAHTPRPSRRESIVAHMRRLRAHSVSIFVAHLRGSHDVPSPTRGVRPSLSRRAKTARTWPQTGVLPSSVLAVLGANRFPPRFLRRRAVGPTSAFHCLFSGARKV